MALLEGAVRELGEVPGGGGGLQRIPQPEECPSHRDAGHDVERASPGEVDVELGERLEAPAEAGRGAADALGDGLELAELGRDEGEDAVGLPEVEAGQHDG